MHEVTYIGEVLLACLDRVLMRAEALEGQSNNGLLSRSRSLVRVVVNYI